MRRDKHRAAGAIDGDLLVMGRGREGPECGGGVGGDGEVEGSEKMAGGGRQSEASRGAAVEPPLTIWDEVKLAMSADDEGAAPSVSATARDITAKALPTGISA